MPMGLSVISSFESLRALVARERNKKGVLAKGQVATAPLVPVFDVLEDFHERLCVMEREHDKKGVMVPDPSRNMIQFVLADNPQASAAAAASIVKAVMGRVMHEVRKLKDENAGEVRAAIAQDNAEWKATATGGHDAMVKLEERLLELLTGR